MTHTRTLKQKFAIYPGRIRRSRLLLHKQTRLVADNSQNVSINNILNDSYSILEDVLTNNNDFEDSNESNGNIEYSNKNNDILINDGNSEDSSKDKYNNLEDISDSPEDSNEDDDFRDNNNDFKDISIDTDGPVSFKPFNGEYGPYFVNFTKQMLFLWVTKHMITTKAYEDLIIIIKHPQFQLRHVPKNTSSTSKPTKLVYTISIKEHLSRVLNNPRLMAKMYFGYGIESQKKSELCHGDIW
ncbi:33869_t:CDS:2 [Gigaspora margarita]|uniref:33869_t:CDS:1 n=1 Tax=Gigaspora margarita TaxID=4874 RepID=A0ABN7V4H2_GIGMA|nr:33869_t:CDS:2 [Gigaspora margarita]